MQDARFILSKSKLKEQVKKLSDEGFKVSYSYKTNHEVGDLIQEMFSEVDFSVHSKRELDRIKNKGRVWFFTQANQEKELRDIIRQGVRNFVVDNEIDLESLLESSKKEKTKINISLRMKFQEHRIGSGKYFVYGMSSEKVNNLIKNLSGRSPVSSLGVHIHRKSQNTTEWEIKEELRDSLKRDSLEKIDFVNLGGGLPVLYRSHSKDVFQYILSKLKEAKDFLESYSIKAYLEPGRFIAAPPVKLETEIIQIQGWNIVLNTTIYRCALDTLLTETKMLVDGELSQDERADNFLIKGNSPTRDDIFRYKVNLINPKVGDKIVFINAGAYNYTTDFFGYKKLETKIVESF